jgi:hypothetical protein
MSDPDSPRSAGRRSMRPWPQRTPEGNHEKHERHEKRAEDVGRPVGTRLPVSCLFVLFRDSVFSPRSSAGALELGRRGGPAKELGFGSPRSRPTGRRLVSVGRPASPPSRSVRSGRRARRGPGAVGRRGRGGAITADALAPSDRHLSVRAKVIQVGRRVDALPHLSSESRQAVPVDPPLGVVAFFRRIVRTTCTRPGLRSQGTSSFRIRADETSACTVIIFIAVLLQ